MKKSTVKAIAQLIFTPCAVMLGGLILLVNPDTASALLGNVLGWVLVLVGILFGVAAVSDREYRVKSSLGGAVCLVLGIWLLRNPLALASGVGRIVGILLAIRGIEDFLESKKENRSLLSGILTGLVGVVLLVLPMTTSRLVFRLLGIGVMVYGGLTLYLRLRRRANTPGLNDPNIIDVDPQ